MKLDLACFAVGRARNIKYGSVLNQKEWKMEK